MSPELAESKVFTATPEGDVYAFSIILIEIALREDIEKEFDKVRGATEYCYNRISSFSPTPVPILLRCLTTNLCIYALIPSLE